MPLALLLSPLYANAKETMFSCEVYGKSTLLVEGLSGLNGGPEGPPGMRHYILDEAAQSLSIVLYSERRPICRGGDQCAVRISDSMITMTRSAVTETSNKTVSTTVIDRLSGRLSETTDSYVNGRPFSHGNYYGPCKPETLEQRKF